MTDAADCVRVAVALDIAGVDRVRAAATSALSGAVLGSREVVLDLHDCEFVDVVGYRMLRELARTADRSGVSLALTGARASVLRVITILDAALDGDLRVHVVADEDAAAPRAEGLASAPS